MQCPKGGERAMGMTRGKHVLGRRNILFEASEAGAVPACSAGSKDAGTWSR